MLWCTVASVAADIDEELVFVCPFGCGLQEGGQEEVLDVDVVGRWYVAEECVGGGSVENDFFLGAGGF